MINFGSAGGYGMQDSDPSLDNKLAALKAKRGNLDDKLASFLERDLGVDPRTVNFTPITAAEFVYDLLDREDADMLELFGTSMGITSGLLTGYDADSQVIDDKHPDWANIVRAYNVLAAPYAAQRAYTVKLRRDYGGVPPIDVEPVQAPSPRNADIASYPSGTTLRIEKPRGDGTTYFDVEYIRIGGLFDDTTPTLLTTMMPLVDTTGWIVTEELS